MDFSNRFGGEFGRQQERPTVQFNEQTYDLLHRHITKAIKQEDDFVRIAALETLVAQYGSVLESVKDIESEVSEEFLTLLVKLNALLKIEQARRDLEISLHANLNH